ncbi:MAG: hypothetical protein LUD47_04105 [Clostridia bacterium]|nr:hypothetical protein [Clostridia bacterium]
MRKFITTSDVGDVVIGNESVLFHIGNGCGDGKTRIEIIDCGEKETSPRDYVTRISGKFNLYNYDCTNGKDEDVIATLSGVYDIYARDGRVTFEKIGG